MLPGGSGDGAQTGHGRPGGEQLLEVRRAQRLGEEVALRALAAEALERLELLDGLDALGDRAEAEAVGDVDDRRDDRGVVLLGAEPVDERAVDLDRVDRDALQARERRVAGAEVVEQDANAARPDRLEGRTRQRGVLEQHALGDLEAQRARLEAAPLEAVSTLRRKSGRAKLPPGTVHGDPEL